MINPSISADTPFVIGGTVPDPSLPNSVLIPRFLNHPDAIVPGVDYLPPGPSMIDHFDNISLDPRWTYVRTPGSNTLSTPFLGLSAVSFHSNGVSQTDGIEYTAGIQTPLRMPDISVIMLKLKTACFVNRSVVPPNGFAEAQVFCNITSLNNLGFFKVARKQVFNQLNGLAYTETVITGANQQYILSGPGSGFDYWQFNTMMGETGESVDFRISMDGRSFFDFISLSNSESGFDMNPAELFIIGASVINAGYAFLNMDWVTYYTI